MPNILKGSVLECVSLSRFKKKLDIKAKKIRQILIKRYLGISNFIAGRRTQKLENATDAFCEYTVKDERFFVPFIFFGNRKVAKKVGRKNTLVKIPEI